MKHQTDHLNGIRSDNRLHNLEWVTSSENQRRAYRSGRKALTNNGSFRRGSGAPNVKFSEEDVLEIRRLWDEGGWTYSALGRRYEVTAGAISLIIRRINWKHVP